MLSKPNLPAKRTMQRFCKRLQKEDDGTSAVEFALVVFPFLAFILAFVEVALVYGGSVTFENALDQAARQIRTGQKRTSDGYTIEQFKIDICDKVFMLPDCVGKIRVDVRAFSDFSSLASADVFGDATDGNGDLKDEADFPGQVDTGAGSSVVLVTAYYKWDLVLGASAFKIGLGNQTDNSRLISAVTAFRNEPFD